MADFYDELTYESNPFPETHPDNLAVLGRLFGIDTVSGSSSRMQELGAATGGNLIPLSWHLPQSEFVGNDHSAEQVAIGNSLITQLGLDNIRLEAADIMDLQARDLGRFDYIVAHGLFSWVPKMVWEKTLQLIQACLKPGGIVYLSYNVLPGWRMRSALRDILLHATANLKARQAVDLQSLAATEFTRADDVAFNVSHPQTKAVLLLLYEAFPASITYPELLSRAAQKLDFAEAGEFAAQSGELLNEMFSLYSYRAVQPRTNPVIPAHSTAPETTADEPVATPLARLQAQSGWSHVATMEHKSLLQLLDGSQSIAAVTDILLQKLQSGELNMVNISAGGEQQLARSVHGNILKLLVLFWLNGLLAGAGKVA